MKILDTKFVRSFVKMADDGFQQGWHERNGGNLSYRLKSEEIQEISSRLNDHGKWMPIGTSVPDLAGEYFLVTGSGKYSRNIIVDPEACIAIIELDDKGVLASGDISHLLSGENDQSQSDRNNQCISFSFL